MNRENRLRDRRKVKEYDIKNHDEDAKNGIEEQRMKKTTGIASNLFSAPALWKMVVIIIVLSFVFGFLALFDFADPSENFTIERLYMYGLVFGILMIAGPAIITGIVITPAAKALGGIFYARRGMLLGLSSVLIIGAILMLSKAASYFITIDFILSLSLGYAWIFAFQLSILMALSNSSYIHSLPPALIQPCLGLVLIYVGYPLVMQDYVMDGSKVTVIALFFIIFLAMTVVWITIVKIPIYRVYKTNGLDIARQGYLHFTEGDGSGMELEGFFESFGNSVSVTAGVLVIRRTKNPKNEKQKQKSSRDKKKYKALIVVPDIHKGPFGYLAGSNMPEKLYNDLNRDSEFVFVPHGTATHDMNPVSSAETHRISRKIKSALDELKPDHFSKKGSKLIRTKVNDSVNISLQYIGHTPVSVYTASPQPTDDIDSRVGKAVREKIHELESELGGGRLKNSTQLFIDGHNSMVAGRGYVHYNSPKNSSILKALSDAFIKTSKMPRSRGIEVGIAEKKGFDVKKDGLGPMGIQVLTVHTPPDSNIAYILFDGNNLRPNLREAIINHLTAAELVDDVEVLTTDNHIVNMTLGGYSPVGEKLNEKWLLKNLEELVKEALAESEPVEAASIRINLDNFKVFGKGNTLKLSTTINNTVSLMGRSFAACYGSALALSLLVIAVFL